MNTSYFTCVESGCKAKAATIGELTLEGLSLKFHRVEQHNHHSDVSKNIVADKLHEFRQRATKNPDKTAKSVYDQLAAEAINSVGTPDKPHLASQLPKFRSRPLAHSLAPLPHSLAAHCFASPTRSLFSVIRSHSRPLAHGKNISELNPLISYSLKCDVSKRKCSQSSAEP